jgi:hypothetical protein
MILTIGEPIDGLVDATVWFLEDKVRGFTNTYRRRVGVDQLMDAGYSLGGGHV